MIDPADVAKRHSIMETVWRYAEASDASDYGRLSRTFTPDGRMLVAGRPPLIGRQEIGEALQEMYFRRRGDAEGNFQRHHVTTSNITFPEGSSAAGVIYALVITELGLDHATRYLDRYELHDGTFLISERTIKLDWITPGSRFSQFSSSNALRQP